LHDSIDLREAFDTVGLALGLVRILFKWDVEYRVLLGERVTELDRVALEDTEDDIELLSAGAGVLQGAVL
jgi:hypothetical protein